MSRVARTTLDQKWLGIEGGGTRTVALLADEHGRLLQRHECGPANLKLLTDAQLVRHFRGLRRVFPQPTAMAIGLAGARAEKDWQRIRRAAAQVWPGVPCRATHDLDTALAAAPAGLAGVATVLVLSGTGSCCYGRTAEGRIAKCGGWGHILGDKGSGYEIGLRALKAVVYYFDRDGAWSRLGQRLLRALQLNEPDELIGWVQSAAKDDIARLAVEVFIAAAEREHIAVDILAGAAHSLARDAAGCARRLVKEGVPVHFVLAGSVLLRQPGFARQVARHLKLLWPQGKVTPLKRESAWGAVELARAQAHSNAGRLGSIVARSDVGAPEASTPRPATKQLSPTEQRNPASQNLDRMPLPEAIRLMLREDARIPAAILREIKPIERLVRWVAQAFRRGGRLFYVGAGTSGRLGVLDASECPPTFRTPPDWVQGIMAGGQRALWSAVEGAEDDVEAGARALAYRGVNARDVVVGIAASGRTPMVWGALAQARRCHARTALICFNPFLKLHRATRPQLVIAPNVGPEILTGSTRLKAGTATKLILNIITTLAMVRMGKVRGNLMVDLHPSNVKLRDRAVRIVMELAGVEARQAQVSLEASKWVVTAALRRLQGSRGRPRTAARPGGA